MKRLLLVAMVLFSGVTFAHQEQPINPDCQKMAENARGFAELKQGGIATTETQLQQFVITPTVETYPVKSLLEYVMDLSDQNPDHVYTNLYQKCTLMGYKDLLAYFDEREDVERLNVALAQRDATINQLRDAVAQLQQENTALKFPVKKVRYVKRVRKADVHPVSQHTTVAQVNTPRELPPGCTLANGQPCQR